MGIVVQKYGGSSVSDPDRIRRVAKRIASTADTGRKVVVIVSAMGDTTDDLIELAQKITKKPSVREMDMLLSTGEQQSASLLAMALCDIGYPAVSLNGYQAGFVTDGVYGKAKIDTIKSERVLSELASGNICVITGFQGIDLRDDINTLGRGGSDTSAAAIAIALNAEICEIYTDVDGVYTADPRVVFDARKLENISYDEMLEMAAMGAGVLHPRCVELAKQFKLRLHVRSSFHDSEGTIVQEDYIMKKVLEREITVSGVAHDTNVIKITVFGIPDRPGIAASIFSALAEQKVNVDMIVQSGSINHQQDISFTCATNDKDKAVTVMTNILTSLPASEYKIEEDLAKISIVGAGMITHSGVAAKMFRVLADIKCNINIISTSEIKISCIIEADKISEAVCSLHKAFNLEK